MSFLAIAAGLASLLSGCPPGSIAGSHGVSACCPERCGACGGKGCELRPGGRAECCAFSVRKANVACGRPPCVIDPTPTTVNISNVRRDLRSRPLVLFLHVPKAGGTSVMSYLSTGTVLFDYQLAIACFARALHADLFRKGDRKGERIASTPPAWCLPKLLELAAAPRNKTVAVEFHDYSTSFFWAAAARREDLTALYARVITAATVREPRSSILSRYKMWPPYTWDKPAPRVAVPLLSWLKGLMEPALHQARTCCYKTERVPTQQDGRCPTTAVSSPRPSWAGTHKSVFQHTLAETWQATNSLVRRKLVLVSDNNTSCPPTQLVAAHLASLDLVCETSNLARFLTHLSGLAGFTPGRVADVHPGRGGSKDTRQRVDRDLADAPGNATVQRALAAVAECDERWFKPTDWTRCEPNRAPQALPEAARKRLRSGVRWPYWLR